MDLTQQHVEMMESVSEGATIFGLMEAKLLREVQKQEPSFITIIDNLDELAQIEGKKYKGTEQLPYFGAILTKDGKKFVKEYNRKA